jgi:hypothetical protein
LERRLKIENFKEKVIDVMDKLSPVVDQKQNQGKFIVHGDMAPNNLYVFENGDVEFLDLEWVSLFDNKVVGMIFDFGNMRARSWKNQAFRKFLDEELINLYKEKKEEKLAKIIICLSILRSNIRFSGYFENYDWDKQTLAEETKRRKTAEEEIPLIWEIIKNI